MRFWVTLVYVEPTYAAHRGRAVRPYRWTYEIDARNAAAAIAAARERFADVARESSVGWVRELIGWDVVLAPPPARA